MSDPIAWTGDLDDDCTAHWRGLTLRAERMAARSWWWAVWDGEIEIGSSWEHGRHEMTGRAACAAAESVAWAARGGR